MGHRTRRRAAASLGVSSQFGPVGMLMDAIMVRKKWDAGIKEFFAGLKQFVEKGGRP